MEISVFDDIKNQINILDVYERYTGNIVNRKTKRALCPFHSDHRPSLGFKNNKFRCFVCEEGGTSLDLVSKFFNLSILEAAKKLDEDYNLNLFYKKSTPRSKKEIRQQIKKYQKEQFNIAFLKKWRTITYKRVLYIFKALTAIAKIPTSPEDEGSEIFAFAQSELQNMTDPKRKDYKWSRIEEKLELLEQATDFEILEEYKNINSFITDLENRWNKMIRRRV